MVAEVLAGIALVSSAVKGIKSTIDTAKDIKDIAGSIDALLTCAEEFFLAMTLCRFCGDHVFQPRRAFLPMICVQTCDLLLALLIHPVMFYRRLAVQLNTK